MHEKKTKNEKNRYIQKCLQHVAYKTLYGGVLYGGEESSMLEKLLVSCEILFDKNKLE